MKDEFQDFHQLIDNAIYSRILHDEVSQILYSIQITLALLKDLEMNENLKKHVNLVQHEVKIALDTVKTMAMQLMPRELDDFGIISAVRKISTTYEKKHHIHVQLEIIDQENYRYSSNFELIVFAIIQTLFVYTMRYHHPIRTIRFQIHVQKNEIRLIWKTSTFTQVEASKFLEDQLHVLKTYVTMFNFYFHFRIEGQNIYVHIKERIH